MCRLMSEFGPGSLPCNVGNFTSISSLDQVQNVDFTAVGLTGQLPTGWGSGFGSLQKLVLAQNVYVSAGLFTLRTQVVCCLPTRCKTLTGRLAIAQDSPLSWNSQRDSG